jgi:Ca2+-binding EF-hand superfamily protein
MATTALNRRIASVFAKHDVDSSGGLDLGELRPTLAELGVHLSNQASTTHPPEST